jgi:outer membrane protein assembly factor BamB
MNKKFLLAGILLNCILFLSMTGFSQNQTNESWNQFRGNERNGVSNETIPDDINYEFVWKKEIGPGFSELLINDNRVYTMYGVMTDSISGFDVLAAFDASTGELKWKESIDSMYVEIDGWGHGPRSTPAIDESNIYSISGNGKLAAYTIDGSEKLWSYDLIKDFGSTRPRWGFSSSPLVIDDMLIVETGGTDERAFTAFNKQTGEILWQKGTGNAAYNSPIIAEFNEVKQVLFVNGRTVHSFSLAGDSLWAFSLPISGPIVMPLIFEDDKIFFSSIHTGDATVQIKDGKPEEIRKGFTMKNDYTTSVYHEGYIYGFHIAAFRCIDAETGDVKWSKRGFGKGSFIQVDDKFIIITDKGKIVVAKANPEIFEELTSFQAIDASRSWTAPSYVNGYLYVRNHKEMACYKLN